MQAVTCTLEPLDPPLSTCLFSLSATRVATLWLKQPIFLQWYIQLLSGCLQKPLITLILFSLPIQPVWLLCDALKLLWCNPYLAWSLFELLVGSPKDKHFFFKNLSVLVVRTHEATPNADWRLLPSKSEATHHETIHIYTILQHVNLVNPWCNEMWVLEILMGSTTYCSLAWAVHIRKYTYLLNIHSDHCGW